MSNELAEQFGFEIGEKVLYPCYVPNIILLRILTVKDIRPLFEDDDNSELVMDVEEFDGYINPLRVYTKDQILKMFDE